MSYHKLRLSYFALLCFGVWTYWGPLQSIISNWSSNPDYSHGFIVPLICAAILYIRRDSLPEMSASASLPGLGLMLVAGVMRYCAGRLYFPELDAWSLPVWIGGWVWLCFGWRCFRWAAPAVGFLWFAMPLPATIEIALSTPLQKLAAGGSAWTLRLLAEPAIAEGTVILLDGHQFEVERACSGLRMFFGILALAVATITFARPGIWKSLLLLASVVPVSIIANVARIDVTALLAKYWSGEVSEGFSHDFAAVAMVPLAAVMFGGMLYLLNSASRRFSENKSSGSAWTLRLGLVAVVLVVSVLFTQRYFEKRTLGTLQKTAKRYEANGEFDKAATYYSRYLSIVPDDAETAVSLAQVSHRTAQSRGNKLRTAQLYLHAWQLAPQRVELAVAAAELATKVREFRFALEVCEKLREQRADTAEVSQAEIDKLYTTALVNFLTSDGARADVTWQKAIDALRQVMESGDYEVWHAVTLSAAIMNYLPEAESGGNLEQPTDRHDSACMVLQKLVDDKPTSPFAWLAKYEFERRNGGCSEADCEVNLEHALDLVDQTSGNEASQVYYIAAQSQLAKENPQAAEEMLKLAIAAQPDNYRAHLGLAQIYLAEEGVDADARAIAALEQGVAQVGGTELSLLVPLASLLARTGQFEKAEELVVPLEKVAPSISEDERGAVLGSIVLVRGRIAAEKESPREALKLLDDFLKSADLERTQRQFPRVYAEVWTFYGDLRSKFGQLDVAIDAYHQAIRLSPGFSALRMQLANLATRSGNLDLAEEQLLGVVDGGNNVQPNADIALARVEIQRQKLLPVQKRNWAAVTRALDTAAQRGAPLEALELVAVEMLISQGQSVEAAQRLANTLKTNGDSALLWRSYAVLEMELDHNESALTAAAKYRELANDRASAVILQSRILFGSDRSDQAIAQLQQELDVEQMPAKLGELFIELSLLNLRSGDALRAVEVLESAHERLPQNSDIVDEAARLAWLRQDWTRLAKYVEWLKVIEGSQGTEWRAYQAQILLAGLESESDPAFRQAIDLIQFVYQHRPDWPKTHFLLGELALIQGRPEVALVSFQQAWQRGSRNILLADRIIDIYTRTDRVADARQFVAQASEMFAFSPQLFDRAIPYYASRAERDQALVLAKSWVDARPDDADAQLRLGRVLMLLAEGQDEQQKAAVLADAENAFRKAVDIAPSEIRNWVACVQFYNRVLDSRENTLATLQEFAKEVSIRDHQKSHVLAQLYKQLGLVDEARRYYLDAILLSSESRDPLSVQILTDAARFYALQSPQLAKSLARRVLAVQSDNDAAKLTLANLLLNDGDTATIEEAGEILKQEFAEINQDPRVPMIRTRIRFLSVRGTPSDLNEAIGLAEGILKKDHDDLRKLAGLYERVNRNGPAFEILSDLGSRVSAQPQELTEYSQDLTEYLRFWQKHFLTTPSDDGRIPFEGGAKQVYAKLAESPELLGEFVRWKLREIKVKKSDPNLVAGDYETLVNEIQATPAWATAGTVEEQQQLLTRLLAVVIHEEESGLAVQLSESCFATLSREAATHALIDALIINRETAAGHDSVIENYLAPVSDPDTDSQDALVQLLGDLRFLQGRYDEAVLLYEKVLDHSTTSTMARNNLALAMAETPTSIQGAREILQTALKQLPDNPQLIDSMATIELIAGNAKSAIEQLKPLTQDHLADASVWLHLAEAHSQVGNVEYAQDAFQRALGLGIERQVLSARDQKWLRDLSERFQYSALIKGTS